MSESEVPRETIDLGDEPVAFKTPEREVEPDAKPPRAILWRIVVEPYEPPKYSSGGIEIPEEALETEKLLTNVAKIVNMGALSYRGTTKSGLTMEADENPKVGDWVVYATYGGQRVKTKAGKSYIIMNDDNILAVVEDPKDYQYWL